MTKRNDLEVKAVKRYRIPQYPSYLEPDPTRFPQPIPFPMRRKVLAAIASVGIASTSCSPPTKPDGQRVAAPISAPTTAKPRKAYQCAQTTVEGEVVTMTTDHALDVAFSGLPHRTSPYGTGVPNYVSEELAREVIERVFRAEGYNLTPDQPYRADGIAFEMDGYDKGKRVGYVFAGRQSLDLDGYASWMTPNVLTDQSRLDAIVSAAQYNPALKSVAEEIATARKLPDVGKQEAALQAVLEKHRAKLLSLEEFKQLDEMAPRTKKFVAVISQFDRRFVEPFPDYEELQKVSLIPDVGKREAAEKEIRMKAAQAAIEKLEECVRDYIEWARSQGAG